MKPETKSMMLVKGDLLRIRREGRQKQCMVEVIVVNGNHVLVKERKALIWMWMEELMMAAER